MSMQGTFGKHKAALTLEKILVKLNNPKITNKIGRILTRASKGFHQIQNIPDEEIRGNLCTLWYEWNLDIIDKTFDFSDEFYSYLKCVVRKHYHETEKIFQFHRAKVNKGN